MEAATRIESSGVNQAPAAAAAPGTPAPVMDREFIIKNQIVERYLAGRLPPKGVTDFERLIRSRPQLIEELGLPEKVNAGLRLLDAAGIAEPWSEKPKKFWETPVFTMGAAGLAVAALIGCLVLGMQVSSRNATIAKQKAENMERAIAPSTRKRTIVVGIARNGPPAQATLSINYGEFAEVFSQVLGRKITYVPLTVEQNMEGMKARGMPDWLITHLATVGKLAANGALSSEKTEPIRDIVKRPPLTTRQFVEDHKAVFS